MDGQTDAQTEKSLCPPIKLMGHINHHLSFIMVNLFIKLVKIRDCCASFISTFNWYFTPQSKKSLHFRKIKNVYEYKAWKTFGTE